MVSVVEDWVVTSAVDVDVVFVVVIVVVVVVVAMGFVDVCTNAASKNCTFLL